MADFIDAYLGYLQIPVTSILDLGCGLGTLLRAMGRNCPDATITGVEYSQYLCEQYGWLNSSVDSYPGPPADLVICSDVLGYLDNQACALAIDNLASLTRQALYLAVLTKEDLATCDRDRTDLLQITRSSRWYRNKLKPHFQAIGGGMFLKKPLKYPLWQLEMGQ